MPKPKDEFKWLGKQVALLESGDLGDIDATNLHVYLIQEMSNIEASILGALRQLLMHLLKARYQPSKHSRSWDMSITEHRARVLDLAGGQGGTLRKRLPEFIAKAYATARRMASQETNLAVKTFPEVCPFSFAEIMDEDFYAKPKKDKR